MEEIKRSGLTLQQAKIFADAAMADVKNGFVSTGYYLKAIRDEKLWKEQGYNSFDAFLNVNYEKDKSWASRCVSLYEKFGVEISPGELPKLNPEFIDYNVSQLIEMISLPEEKRELVTPETPVRAIREMKPKREKKVETVATSEPEEKQDSLKVKQSPIERGCITGLSPYGVCSCCGNEGVKCCGECEESCNGRCGWLETVSKDSPQEKQNSGFNLDPTGCPYRKEYSCTVPAENRSVPGDGYNCGSSCCWSCKFHGACKLECNSSAGRDGTLPDYDAAWFVKEWAAKAPGELERALKICHENSTNAERTKAVQKCISPYGAYSHGCSEYNFSFHSFVKGIDFRVGKVELHFTYSRFVQELMSLYPDPQEPKTVIEEPENVPEQEESVPESNENVIDGEYVEVTSESKSPFVYSLEDIREETNFLKEQLKLLGDEDCGLKFARKLRMQYDAILLVKKEFENLNQQNNESEEPEEPEQPELPILKNNDQRAAFVDAYESWPLWIETEETGERYYRYDLSEKVAIVVKVYWKHSWESYKESKDYEYGAQQYYLLGVKSEWRSGKNVNVEDESRTFYECSTNRSALVEYLKNFQKSK